MQGGTDSRRDRGGNRPQPATARTAGDEGLVATPPPDFDYAAAFGCLAAVQARINCYGATPELVLRRGLALMALGNHLAAAYDAERVLQGEPGNVEAHYLHGQACLALAGVKAGLLRPGVGASVPASALPSGDELLDAARQAFEAVLAANPADGQAAKGLAAVGRMRRRKGPPGQRGPQEDA